MSQVNRKLDFSDIKIESELEEKEYDEKYESQEETKEEFEEEIEYNETEYIRNNVILGYNPETNHWHCIQCGEDMGNNSRQLCGKTFCYFE
jgi:hypothetical protein